MTVLTGVINKYKKIVTFQQPVVWINVFGYTVLYSLFFYTLLAYFPRISFKTLIWNILLLNISMLGVTAGVHRLWSHKTYKATLPLRIFLMSCYLTAGQWSIISWCRDHRLHHKFTDTDADPHNSNRGFFFSHNGWLMMRRHPEVKRRGKEIDMSDLWNDPVVAFQQKYFKPLLGLFFIIIPVMVPVVFWNEKLFSMMTFTSFLFRYVIQLNSTWTVNSVGHFFGTKPYNKNIRPVENGLISFLTFGEGWHNFHHTFPWDYRTANRESKPNVSAFFIDVCARLGLAYDLKAATDEMVQKVVEKNYNSINIK